MIQRQKPRYTPGTWQAEIEKKLWVADDGAAVVAHLSPDLALPFLKSLLRREYRQVSLEKWHYAIAYCVVYLALCGIQALLGKVAPRPLEILVFFALLSIGIFFQTTEARTPRWRNALQATFFHLERSTISERLPILLEITCWLHQRPRLVTPETRQRFDRLLTETLAKTDTGLLESLEPEAVAQLIALVTHSRKAMPDTLLVAAILALSPLRPESIPLRQKLHKLTYHSSPRVREAVEEFYRVAK